MQNSTEQPTKADAAAQLVDAIMRESSDHRSARREGAKIGAGLACIGIAVALFTIGLWILPDA